MIRRRCFIKECNRLDANVINELKRVNEFLDVHPYYKLEEK